MNSNRNQASAITGATRRISAATAVMSAVLMLAACAHSGAPGRSQVSAVAQTTPKRIVPGPRNLIAAAEPQPNGTMWILAGRSSTGLFRIDSASGQVAGSTSVSVAARSVAESARGIIGLALRTHRSGALELRSGRTAKLIRTVSLPAPARQVVAGPDGTMFYVLTAWATSASVTVVNSRTGKIHGGIPVPADTVSIVPAAGQAVLYALQENGLVDEISIASGRIDSDFAVGGEGRSLALTPDGSTLYVLKGTSHVANIAVVNVATQHVRSVRPAPSHCLELLVSPSGNQLYEVVGTPGYGNIQVFAL
jgi:DNA-binding beta-propeller fold protein YncE